MPIVFVKGDIFETDGIRAYAFGANTDGSLNAGIAIAIKKRWPAFAAAYEARCTGDSPLQVGDVFSWTADDITLFALGIAHGEAKPSFSALTQALRRMQKLATEAKLKRVGVSRINGVDWTRARKMLSEISIGQTLQLDVFEQFIRNHAS
jgi:O-acetyl-ADP-ribose deacetylase (regulator of RNase III)